MRSFNRTRYLLVFIAFSFAAAVSAQVSIGKRTAVTSRPKSKLFDAARILRDIETLSADEMEGRSADRPAMQKARAFVEKRFRESGLRPMSRSFRQEFEIRSRASKEVLRGVNFVG
jgi:hypothetical protein